MWRNGYCSGTIGPDNDPFYYIDAAYSFDTSTISLNLKRETGLDTPYGYVKKQFSAATLSSDPCNRDTVQKTLPNGITWTYGYFEMRCKNPKSQLMWPAFWLLGPGNSHCAWNEIDIFEFGTGDDLVMTNHYGYGGKFISRGLQKWLYAIPGQTFGDTWVTYGLLWDPDKIIWYINNIPVRVQTTKDSVLIPNSAMHLIASTGFEYSFTPYDLYLPSVLPNAMQIDYIRVYQRPDYTIPSPSFLVNNQQSFISQSPISIPFANNLPIIMDASKSFMPNSTYFLSIQQCDNMGNLSGTEAMAWLDSNQVYSINQLDITAFAQSLGINLLKGNEYRIKLAGTSPWTESNQYIYLDTCINSIVFKVNGQNQTTYPNAINIANNYGKPRLIVDASNSISCSDSFLITLQQCDQSGLLIGNVIVEWLPPNGLSNLSGIDIEYFSNSQNFPLQYGNYYLLKIAAGDTTFYSRQIIHINDCINSISFSINGNTNNFPTAISIGNGQDIILDGSASNFCNNNFNLSIQACDIAGNPIGQSVSEWDNYIAGNGPYYYTIGRSDIRGFCLKHNFILNCGTYYLIKLSAGDTITSQTKIIYIEPCPSTNNSFTVWANDASPVHCSRPCPDADCCSGKEYITLYAPNSISCNQSYFLSIQKLDYFLHPIGNEAAAWLTLNDITNLKTNGTLDVHAFARDTSHNGGIKFKADGTYRIKLMAATGACNADSTNEFSTIIYLGKGTPIITPDSISNSIKIFPNPTDGFLAISLPANGNTITLNITDVRGRILKSIQTNANVSTINITDIAPGIYFIQAIFPDKVLVNKFEIFRK